MICTLMHAYEENWKKKKSKKETPGPPSVADEMLYCLSLRADSVYWKDAESVSSISFS